MLVTANIARLESEAIEGAFPENREIDAELAKRVAHGEFTVAEALEKRRER